MAILPVNQMIQQFDIPGAWAQGQATGMRLRAARRAEDDEQSLRELTTNALAGDTGAFNQMTAISPERGAAVRKAEDSNLTRLRGFINYVDKARSSGQPEAVSAALRAVGPYVSREFLGGKPMPEQWSPEMDEGWEVLKARVAGAGTAGGTPTGFQEFDMKARAAGLTPGTPEYEQAAKVALGVEGRASSAGYSQVKFTGADGRERLGVLNGRTGQIDLPDGTSFNPQTGQIAPTAAEPASAPAGVYIDPSLPPEVQQQIAAAEAAGRQVPSQMYIAGGGGQSGAAASPFVGRRAEDEAAAKRAAEAAVDLAVLPQRQAIENQGMIDRKSAETRLTQDIERQQKQREQDTVFAQYEAALSGLKSGLSNATTGPIAGRLPALTADAQIAEGAVAALAPVLKQLFRAAGEGTFTDRDQALLLEMVPTRTDLPEARGAKLQNIDNIVRAKLGQGGQARAPAATVRRARNPQTGEVLVLRNGQWVPE